MLLEFLLQPSVWLDEMPKRSKHHRAGELCTTKDPGTKACLCFPNKDLLPLSFMFFHHDGLFCYLTAASSDLSASVVFSRIYISPPEAVVPILITQSNACLWQSWLPTARSLKARAQMPCLSQWPHNPIQTVPGSKHLSALEETRIQEDRHFLSDFSEPCRCMRRQEVSLWVWRHCLIIQGDTAV